jgi:segregation and condensation protein A
MAYSVALETYKGPLDVLLELITEKKLEINQISLSEVTNQFLKYIEKNDLPPKDLSDFLSVAVRLLHIKTKALLPYLYEDTDDDEVSLEHQLKIYQVYWTASQMIDSLYAGKTRLFAKTKLLNVEAIFSPPSKKQVAPNILKTLFFTMINGLEEIKALPHTSIKKTVSLVQKMVGLKEILRKVSKLKFKTFVYGGKNTTDVIINFLAVLEMIKQRELDIEATTGGDLILKKL